MKKRITTNLAVCFILTFGISLHLGNGLNAQSSTTNYQYTVNSNYSFANGIMRLNSNTGGNNNWTVQNRASYFEIYNGSNRWLQIQPNGNVGIGNIAPSTNFHVGGNTRIDGKLEARGQIELWPNSSQNLDIRMDSHSWMKWNIQNGPNNSDFIGRFHFFSDSYSVASARGIATFEGYRGIILGEWSSPSLYVKRDPAQPSAIGPVGIGTRNVVDGARLTVDGRVYISEQGGSERGFSNTSHSNYQDYLLWVEEGIVSVDFAIAELADWPDYVFDEDYQLKSLNQVESFINANGHLPTMPAASEIEAKGFTIGDMTKRMVQTIEELTLHTIEQQKQIADQNALIEQLAARLSALEADKKQ